MEETSTLNNLLDNLRREARDATQAASEARAEADEALKLKAVNVADDTLVQDYNALRVCPTLVVEQRRSLTLAITAYGEMQCLCNATEIGCDRALLSHVLSGVCAGVHRYTPA